MDTVTSTPVHSSANRQHSTASLHCIGLQAIVACLSYSGTLLSRMHSAKPRMCIIHAPSSPGLSLQHGCVSYTPLPPCAKLTIIYIKCSHIVFAFQAMLTYYVLEVYLFFTKKGCKYFSQQPVLCNLKNDQNRQYHEQVWALFQLCMFSDIR